MSNLRKLILLVISLTVTASYSWANNDKNQSKIILANDVSWGYLNPLRGDKSPGAADLWGARTKNIATGMLVRFNKGFSSPPHIHNISYRGVVIEGLMHNGDPSAESMWLPTASYWTQPAGGNHITAANGESNLIYLEIDSGPYLVKPSDKQYDNGQRPINVHASNLVWLAQDEMASVDGKNIEIANLWKSNKPNSLKGSLVKTHANFKGKITSNATEFRVVVISGSLIYTSKEIKKSKKLFPGSYFSSSGDFTHNISTTAESIVYIRSNGQFLVSSDF